jgi:alpha-maltose-1-phosphate synthase
VPWMPSKLALRVLGSVPGLMQAAARLGRRRFEPLSRAPKLQGRIGEWGRMAKRMLGGAWADERLSYQANDWLMRIMSRECRRNAVTAVHAYEDCSLLQFQEAARTGKARIYDLPIGYYPAWESTSRMLAAKYAEWLPGDASDNKYVRPEQKRQEMELADLVIAPSGFVQRTVQRFVDRKVALVPYGVDAAFWCPGDSPRAAGPMRFLYAGQCSVRKGTPLLIEAWRRAAPADAVLDLVGQWQLSSSIPGGLPRGISLHGPASPEALRRMYRASDILVFPSNFEGFGLVILEAMACGLPVIASDATAGPDLLDETTGRVVPADDLDALAAALRWAAAGREEVARMRGAARDAARDASWRQYRDCVRAAVAPLVGAGLPGASA